MDICTAIVVNSANKLLETALPQDNMLNCVSEVESLIETELTEALPEQKSQSQAELEGILLNTSNNQTTSFTQTSSESQEGLNEEEIQARSNKSVTISPILVRREAWRDRREFFLLESPPDPRHSEQYIRCDTLSVPEQICLSEQRTEICSRLISEYRDCQSKHKPNFSEKWNLLEKSIKSREGEIALEQKCIEVLVNTQSSAVQGDCETVSQTGAPGILIAVTSVKDSATVPVFEQELSLYELACAINEEHQLFQGDYKSSLLHAYKAGQFLLTSLR